MTLWPLLIGVICLYLAQHFTIQRKQRTQLVTCKPAYFIHDRELLCLFFHFEYTTQKNRRPSFSVVFGFTLWLHGITCKYTT